MKSGKKKNYVTLKIHTVNVQSIVIQLPYVNSSLECFTTITAGIICNYLNELNAYNAINKMQFPHSPVTHGYPHVMADNLYEILKICNWKFGV